MTSDRDALYRAICLHPDEDVPRLAFADLIEEDGDSFRAAFIRAQVELARVPDYDPLAVKCRQFTPEVVTGWAMAHTLPSVPDGFMWRPHEFRRGFPWLVGVRPRAGFLDQLPDLFDAAPVQALHFGVGGSNPDGFAFAESPHAGRVRRLEFNVTQVHAPALAVLCGSANAIALTELAFSYNAITADGLQELARSRLFARLEVLELSANHIAPELLVDALAAAREPGSLRALNLSHSDLTHQDAAHLFALPVVQGVSRLDLSGNKVNAEGVVALTESGTLSGLRVLSLSKSYPGVPGVKALADASGLAGLRSLDLSANRLGPVAVRTLAESSGVRGLRVLSLKDNPVGGSGAKALAACPHLSGLLELDLENAGIDDEGAIALAESPHLDGLLRLIVRDRVRGTELGAAARAALRERFGDCVTM